jgi:multicomponent Na+:H+ antiporter subunit D
VTANLPALQVVLPLIAAAICVLLRSGLASWLVFAFASAGSLAVAAALAVEVYGDGPVHYVMGGWTAPAGIELVVDGANIPVLLLLGATSVIVAIYGRRSVAAEVEGGRTYLFYALLCLLLAGLVGIAVTGDAFNLFVFLEISSLSSYALIALGRRRRALLASFQYLVLGTIGGTFVLIGIGLTYAVTGTLNMADLAQRLPEVYENRALAAAVVFIFVGLGIKMAIFPLHAWLPNAYAEAPSAISLFIAAVGTKVAIYAFARFAFSVFGREFVFEQLPVGQLALLVASLAMLVAAAIACVQQDFKRLLAWSSISQIGLIVAGISLATPSGISAAYLHLINHAITAGALFAVAGIVLLRLGSTSLNSLAGLGRRMPLTFAAMVIAGLGLVGVPPTAGFVSKWALASALIEQGEWVVLAVLLVSSLVALVYVGRLVEIGWFRPPPEVFGPGGMPAPSAGHVDGTESVVAVQTLVRPAEGTIQTLPRSPRTMAAVTGLLVLASLYFGIDASWTSSLADGAADVLFGSGSR